MQKVKVVFLLSLFRIRASVISAAAAFIITVRSVGILIPLHLNMYVTGYK